LEAHSGGDNVRSPETYIGYHRAENFASAQPLAQDSRKVYTPRNRLSLNQWALGSLEGTISRENVLEKYQGAQ
jgi:hypothetical protein